MTDVFRSEYRELTTSEQAQIHNVKEVAGVLYELLDRASQFARNSDEQRALARQRALALARTNLEQAVMWAVKGITT